MAFNYSISVRFNLGDIFGGNRNRNQNQNKDQNNNNGGRVDAGAILGGLLGAVTNPNRNQNQNQNPANNLLGGLVNAVSLKHHSCFVKH